MKVAFFHIRSAAGRSDNLLTPHRESCRDKLAEQALRAGKVAFAVCSPSLHSIALHNFGYPPYLTGRPLSQEFRLITGPRQVCRGLAGAAFAH